MSYSCTQNLARKISSHNSKILQTNSNGQEEKGCNCRVKANCPVGGQCQKTGVVYQAEVKRETTLWTPMLGCLQPVLRIVTATTPQVLGQEIQKIRPPCQNMFGGWRIKGLDTKLNGK